MIISISPSANFHFTRKIAKRIQSTTHSLSMLKCKFDWMDLFAFFIIRLLNLALSFSLHSYHSISAYMCMYAQKILNFFFDAKSTRKKNHFFVDDYKDVKEEEKEKQYKFFI